MSSINVKASSDLRFTKYDLRTAWQFNPDRKDEHFRGGFSPRKSYFANRKFMRFIARPG
jgi:hypothetical protein